MKRKHTSLMEQRGLIKQSCSNLSPVSQTKHLILYRDLKLREYARLVLSTVDCEDVWFHTNMWFLLFSHMWVILWYKMFSLKLDDFVISAHPLRPE